MLGRGAYSHGGAEILLPLAVSGCAGPLPAALPPGMHPASTSPASAAVLRPPHRQSPGRGVAASA